MTTPTPDAAAVVAGWLADATKLAREYGQYVKLHPEDADKILAALRAAPPAGPAVDAEAVAKLLALRLDMTPWDRLERDEREVYISIAQEVAALAGHVPQGEPVAWEVTRNTPHGATIAVLHQRRRPEIRDASYFVRPLVYGDIAAAPLAQEAKDDDATWCDPTCDDSECAACRPAAQEAKEMRDFRRPMTQALAALCTCGDSVMGPCRAHPPAQEPGALGREAVTDEMVNRAKLAPFGGYSVCSFIPLKSPHNLDALIRAALEAALATPPAAPRGE